LPNEPGDKALDDWDSLPLDPDADDWDDPKPAAAAPSSPPVADKGAEDDDWDDPEPAAGPSSLPAAQKGAEADDWDDEPIGPADDWDDSLEAEPARGQDEASEGRAEDLGQDSGDSAGWDDADDVSSASGDWDGQGLPPHEQAALGLDDGEEADLSSPLAEDSSRLEEEAPPRFAETKAAPSDSRQKSPSDTGRTHFDRIERPALPVDGDDQSRNDFLKSLMDGENDAVPQKVELDLDGIFDQARKEAEQLSPEATHLPVEAPKPDEPAPDPSPEADLAAEAALSPAEVKKVARYKMLIVLGTLGVVVLGMLFALYRIFFRSAPPAPQVRPFVVEPDTLLSARAPIPGEMPLGRFYLTLGEAPDSVVVEMEITLHYHDSPDAPLISGEMTLIRDLIYRLTKPLGPALLTDPDVRRQLQADLLQTLNNIEALRSDPADPRLTYVQISLLGKR
jgi:flagellar basal body-associated protein FliL